MRVQETQRSCLTHLTEIEQEAENIIEEQGFDYPVEVVVEKTYFPEKTYGDPPGWEYEALKVKIGSAKGQNWWCVLYPEPSPFLDNLWHCHRSEKGKPKEVLAAEEFQKILGDSREKKKLRFGFRWF